MVDELIVRNGFDQGSLAFDVVGGGTRFVPDTTTITIHDAGGAQVGESIRPVVSSVLVAEAVFDGRLAPGAYTVRVATSEEVAEGVLEVPQPAAP